MAIIKVVLAERRVAGQWLAEQLGKSENTVPKSCSNKIYPLLVTLFEIAQVLDIDMRLLIVSTKNERLSG